MCWLFVLPTGNTLAALTGKCHSVHSTCRRGKHFGENGAKPGRVDRKMPFCAFCVSTRQWLSVAIPYLPLQVERRNVAGGSTNLITAITSVPVTDSQYLPLKVSASCVRHAIHWPSSPRNSEINDYQYITKNLPSRNAGENFCFLLSFN